MSSSTGPWQNRSVTADVCTISAYWSTGITQYVPNDGFNGGGLLKTDASSVNCQSSARPIVLNFSGADLFRSGALTKLLTSSLPDVGVDFHGSDLFRSGTMTRSLMSLIPDVDGFQCDDGGSCQQLLANVLAVALAQLPVNFTTPVSSEVHWAQPPPQDNPLFYDSTDLTSNIFPVPYNFTLTEYGYGYGARSTSIYLAMAVISTYCAITIAYIIYCIATGSVSNAWSSGIELFTLALQSRKPDHLGHTAVGMDSIRTFREGVGVRVNQDNELEIVFANDRDFGTRHLRRINENSEY